MMTFRITFVFAIALALLAPDSLLAHCDAMDGPVVKAAQKAIATGDVSLVLFWAQQDDEPEIRKAFESNAAVRKLGAAARELADRYFYETLVRIHRAGEGAPYTGIKPAGLDPGPAIRAADRAIEDGSVQELFKLLSQGIHHGVEARFKALTARKNFDTKDAAAGREFVKAYVEFVHYVERIHQASSGPAHGNSKEPHENAAPEHEH